MYDNHIPCISAVFIFTFLLRRTHTYRHRQIDRQTDTQPDLSSQCMIIIFPVHLSCIHIPSKTHTCRDRQTDRQTDTQPELSSQYMIIIFPVHLSCIHIPSKTHTYRDRQTDRLIFTMHDNHIPSASQLYSHSFKDTHIQRQTDRQTHRHTDTQTYLHNI